MQKKEYPPFQAFGCFQLCSQRLKKRRAPEGWKEEKKLERKTRVFWRYSLCAKEPHQEKICRAAGQTCDVSDGETAGKEVKSSLQDLSEDQRQTQDFIWDLQSSDPPRLSCIHRIRNLSSMNLSTFTILCFIFLSCWILSLSTVELCAKYYPLFPFFPCTAPSCPCIFNLFLMTSYFP